MEGLVRGMAEGNQVNMGIKAGIRAGDYKFSLSASRQWNQEREEHENIFVLVNEDLAGMDDVFGLLLQLSGRKDIKLCLPLPFAVDKTVLKTGDGKQREIYFNISDRTSGKSLAAADLEIGEKSSRYSLSLETSIPLHEIPVAGSLFGSEDHIGGFKLVILQKEGKIADYGGGMDIQAGLWNKKIGCGLLVGGDQDGAAPLWKEKAGRDESQRLALPPADEDKPGAPEAEYLPQSSDQDIKWVKIEKSFGPFSIPRVGFKLKTSESLAIVLYLDIRMDFSMVEIQLAGLHIGIPVAEIQEKGWSGLKELSFGLDGLGLRFESGGLKIGGALIKEGDNYSGALTVKYDKLQLTAIGTYGKLQEGGSTLFAYALLQEKIGGPPAFFITGLAAGFGVNKDIRMPSIDGVREFPLVSAVMEKSKRAMAPMEMLEALTPYLTDQKGHNFLAVGIEFNSFKIVNSFALLFAKFGAELEFHLLGLSVLSMPLGKKDPMVYVQMALKASVLPKQGIVMIEGKLTEESYLFSRECHITGGFAMAFWFGGNENAGDFVVTIGGYHPAFVKPDHYPDVRRVGINWQIDSHLTLGGEAYFALTPCAVMAGGKLELVFRTGGLRAWFKAQADFILNWAPFYYDVFVSVNIGIAYTFKFLGIRKTLALELGASLHLYGPEFAGEVSISLFIISFTISFGDKKSTVPALSWMEFRNKFLEDTGQISVSAGLNGVLGEGKSAVSLVDGRQTSFSYRSKLPVTSIFLGNREIMKEALSHYGVLPMGEKLKLVNRVTIRIRNKDRGFEEISEEAYSRFRLEIWNGNMPPAIWGKTRGNPLRADMLGNVPVGFLLELVKPEPNAAGFYDEDTLTQNEIREIRVKRPLADCYKVIENLVEESGGSKTSPEKAKIEEQRRQTIKQLYDVKLWSGEPADMTPGIDYKNVFLAKVFSRSFLEGDR